MGGLCQHLPSNVRPRKWGHIQLEGVQKASIRRALGGSFDRDTFNKHHNTPANFLNDEFAKYALSVGLMKVLIKLLLCNARGYTTLISGNLLCDVRGYVVVAWSLSLPYPGKVDLA